MNKMSSAWSLFKQAFRLFTKKMGTLIGLSVLPTIVAGGIAIIIELVGNANQIVWVGAIALGVIIVIYVVIWFELAMVYAVTEDNLTIGQALEKCKDRVGSFFWTGFLTGLMILLGFILLVVPGFIFLVWYCLVSFVFVSENLSGSAAMKQSKEYVKGHWGAVAGRIAFLFIVFIVLAIIGSIAFGNQSTADRIYSAIISLVLGPVGLIYEYLVYLELRKMKAQPMAAEPVAAPVIPPQHNGIQ